MNKNPRKELERLGYTIVYKPHRQVAAHMAFYKVKYKGKILKCNIVHKYDIPMNEIWLSENLKPYEKYILYHELKEIEYRAKGFGYERSHEKALKDEKIWKGKEKWEELRKEINLVTKDKVTELKGFGPKMFERIKANRPYFSMEELKKVTYIGLKRFYKLKNMFWCFD